MGFRTNSAAIRIAIDRGGTFTDVHAYSPGSGQEFVFKLLSVDPRNYNDAPTEGIRRVLEKFRRTKVPKDEPMDLHDVESIRMGTTVATNALLERQGERVAFLTTKGFRDLLVIGNQARPHIFDLTIKKLENLYEKVVEIDERVTMESYSEDPEPKEVNTQSSNIVLGLTGEPVRIIKKPDLNEIRSQLSHLRSEGYESVAICLIHSYLYPNHEQQVAELAASMGFSVSASAELQPTIKMVPRANSAIADAYLSPLTRKYIEGFGRGFKGGINGIADKLLFMQSDGGLCLWSKFSGLRAILSGPAGGVVGYAQACYDYDENVPLLGFDMGGTSTDVSRFAGAYDHVFETTTAEVTIQTPQLDINTVAAGGGSILHWKNGMFAIGPDSAGAHPGPACYKKGGQLTVTDANLYLGRLLPSHFPSIFGPNEDEPLDVEITTRKFEELTAQINIDRGGSEKYTAEEVASGFLRVANEGMSRPIRSLTEGRGLEASRHALAIFGGAGGQHACSVADALGIKTSIIHKYSSILSAYGMALADITHEVQTPMSASLEALTVSHIQDTFAPLVLEAKSKLAAQGFQDDRIEIELFLNLRYRGTDSSLMMLKPSGSWDFADAFIFRHKEEYGFTLDRPILVDDARVRVLGKNLGVETKSPFKERKEVSATSVGQEKRLETARVYCGDLGWKVVDVYDIGALMTGDIVNGPSIIVDQTQTIYVEPGWEAVSLSDHLFLQKIANAATHAEHDLNVVDPIQLSVFGHRFMSIAEQMGNTLQKTSVSVNIKERLDFSCAIFSPSGGLVANAPHIPCHLGAMSYAVAYQAETWGNKLKPGDVIVSNHPIAGGSHLPDITVITPVIDEKTQEVLFWCASRGHHADIGGITAGSMPPNSKEIWQEGASFTSFKLVSEGKFDEEGLVDIMLHQPAKYPGCSGTRTLRDNISDLKAQVAANSKGIGLIQDLIKDYGLDVVQLYMHGIQSNAEKIVRNLLRTVYDRFNGLPLQAVDHMDDGTALKLKIHINREKGQATFDFTGTGREVYGNLNAPKAITFSAIIYVLRSLVDEDIPLNQGCLAPIDVILPEGTILSPSAGAATVAGNTDTSQRVTDLVLKAFQASGASQGTCNNLTFGFGGHMVDGKVQPGFGYYETIAGGAGAGPTWKGQSGVHVHMTNTRITDPETIEKRYPCILHEFSIRKGSGGRGRFNGGDGCIRDIEFRVPVELSVLTERRTIAPYGMCGGGPGACGENIWVKRDQSTGKVREISLGGKNTCNMAAGDRIIIRSPGGGAYGEVRS